MYALQVFVLTIYCFPYFEYPIPHFKTYITYSSISHPFTDHTCTIVEIYAIMNKRFKICITCSIKTLPISPRGPMALCMI